MDTLIIIALSALVSVAINIIIKRLDRKWRFRNLFKSAKGTHLDNIGELLGITRNKDECDKAYRERLRNTILMKGEKNPHHKEVN